MNRVITISRQFGSGGRTIGKMVAERLDLPYYDHALIDVIAKNSEYAKEFKKERGEQIPFINWFSNAWSGRDMSGYSVQDDLWAIQKQVIRDLAEKSPCVIVGRCADYILKDYADLLTVFIHAPFEMRADRIVSVYGGLDVPPEKRLNDKDNRRRAYYQIYTDMTWGDVENYHITLNSGVLGLEVCADMIVNRY